jgi:hypothetical protein
MLVEDTDLGMSTSIEALIHPAVDQISTRALESCAKSNRKRVSRNRKDSTWNIGSFYNLRFSKQL